MKLVKVSPKRTSDCYMWRCRKDGIVVVGGGNSHEYTGKRLCAGETFARQNLFLTFSALLQNFTVDPDGVPLPDNPIPGIIETAPSFWAKFVPR